MEEYKMKKLIISLFLLPLLNIIFLTGMDAPFSSSSQIDYDQSLAITDKDIEDFIAFLGKDINECEGKKEAVPHFLCLPETLPQRMKTYLYSCKCGDPFNTLTEFKQHILAVHTDFRPYVCNEPGCDQKYARSSNFLTHMSRIHFRKGNTELSLDMQRKTAAAINPHLPPWKFKCETCYSLFPSKLSLSNHYSFHSDTDRNVSAHPKKQLISRKRKAVSPDEKVSASAAATIVLKNNEKIY